VAAVVVVVVSLVVSFTSPIYHRTPV